jgi:hypothetical protein
MRKTIISFIIILLVITIWSIPSYAGNGRIQSVNYDGNCVRVTYNSTEDDSRDKWNLRVSVRTSRGKQWGTNRGWRGLTQRTKYKEICGRSLRAEYCVVSVQLFHNGRLDDQYQWTGSKMRR